MREFLNKKMAGVPVYGVIAGVLLLLLCAAAYLAGTAIDLPQADAFLSMRIRVGEKLPLIPWFYYIYLASFIIFLIAPMAAAKGDPRFYADYFAGAALTFVIILVCLIFIPTESDMTAAELEALAGDGFTGGLLRDFYARAAAAMESKNFPSVHGAYAAICIIGTAKSKELGRFFKVFVALASILAAFSALFIKRHTPVEIIGGALIALAAYAIARALRLGRPLYFAVHGRERRFLKKG